MVMGGWGQGKRKGQLVVSQEPLQFVSVRERRTLSYCSSDGISYCSVMGSAEAVDKE